MTSILQIEHFACNYLVARDHPSPHALRSEMDGIARKYVAEACGRTLAALLDPDDPSVWIIRDIELDLLLDVHAAAADTLAAFWGDQMARRVATTIGGGVDGERILHFPNRTAYLAYLLEELANGAAWSKWYFAEFDSLRALPTGAAIREAIRREPERAESVLFELAASNRLGPVLNKLSALDQELLLETCAAPIEHSATALRAVLPEIAARLRSRPISLIAAYVHTRLTLPDLPPGQAAGAVLDTIDILQQLRRLSQNGSVFEPRQRHTAEESLAPQTAKTLLLFQELMQSDPHFPAMVTDILGTTTAAGPALVRFSSPLGAVFLLIPFLLGSRELRGAFTGSDSALQRYLLFVSCFAPKFRDAWRDPAVKFAAGLSEIPDLPTVTHVPRPGLAIGTESALPEDVAYFLSCDEWIPESGPISELRSTLAAAAALLLRAFAQSLPALGGCGMEYLWHNVLSGDSQITVTPQQITVELTPRPLQIVLHMAGLREIQYEIPWQETVLIKVGFRET